MGNEKTMPLTAEALNGVVTAMGALVFAVVRQLAEEKREPFAKDLARLAQQMNDSCQTSAETLLIDLHRAAVAAGRSKG